MKKTNKVVKQQQKIIAQKDAEIARLRADLKKTSRTKLAGDVEETNKEVKETRKFNVKAWLATSCFAIASCVFGLTNLILNVVKR